MKKYKLKNCCNFIDYRGKTPEKSEDGYRLITAKNVKPLGYCDDPKEYIPIESYESVMVRGIPRVGDILFTTEAPLGNVGRIPEFTKLFAVGQRLIVIQPNEELLDYQYMVYKLRSNSFQEELLRHSSGSTVRGIRSKELIEIEIEFPELLEQKKVSKVFSVLERIIETRKIELLQLDDLIKARFVELFGECKNKVRLGDCCEVHARIGWQALTKNEHMKNGEYMLVTGTDFKDGEINYSTCVYVAKERYEMDKHIILKNDDVLITKDGTIGKVAVVHNLPKPATLNAGVFVVRPDDRFNKTFIANVFKGTLFSDFVESSKTGATIKHLNQKHLVEFMIPVPTINEQEAFASFSNQIDKSKFVVQKALDEAQTLFDSLMQEYFG